MSNELISNPTGFEVAAGGLVWSTGTTPPTIAIVRRSAHRDCALPKGRPEPGESIADTALREAQEETGRMLKREEFLGSYAYVKKGTPKVVLLWRMVDTGVPFDRPAGDEEIASVDWLEPDQAVAQLSHDSERAFVARLTETTQLVPGTIPRKSPKLARLAAALATVRSRLTMLLGSQPDLAGAPWAVGASLALNRVEANLRQEKIDLDGAWGALHDAERLMVGGLPPTELLTLAISLEAETSSKLGGWRNAATTALFSTLDLPALLKTGGTLATAQEDALRAAVAGALKLLHEDSDNRYHRLNLVASQLAYLVWVLAGVLGMTLVLSYWLGTGEAFNLGRVLMVLIAGALGGTVSAMFQLSRVGEAKVPEALMHGLITSGRPLVAAASALFIYALLESKVVSLVPSDLGNAVIFVFSFIAGFSEKFVIGAVGKVVADKGN